MITTRKPEKSFLEAMSNVMTHPESREFMDKYILDDANRDAAVAICMLYRKMERDDTPPMETVQMLKELIQNTQTRRLLVDGYVKEQLLCIEK